MIRVLRSNIALNDIEQIVFTEFLGFGLSDATADGYGMRVAEKNLAGGRMMRGSGDLAVRKGDDLLEGQQVDFMKIDVERMEMQVLSGLDRTIRRWRPPMFIEIDKTNNEPFDKWLQEHQYKIERVFERGGRNNNYMCMSR